MDDNTPANTPPPAPGTPPPSPPPAEPADRALDAAQQAVDNLKTEAKSPASAASGGDDAAAAALKAAQAAIAQARELSADNSTATPAAAPFPLPKVAPAAGLPKAEGIDLLADVNLNVRIELGRTRMLVEDVLRLGEGSVVELDKLAGDPVDVYVNDRHVAKGEVLVLNDNFCVRINEIVEQMADAR